MHATLPLFTVFGTAKSREQTQKYWLNACVRQIQNPVLKSDVKKKCKLKTEAELKMIYWFLKKNFFFFLIIISFLSFFQGQQNIRYNQSVKPLTDQKKWYPLKCNQPCFDWLSKEISSS